MVKYKFREPDYVGFWNTFGDSRSSIFIAYVGQRISDGKWLVERGRMMDDVGIMEYKAGHDSNNKLCFEGAYIPDLSGGYSGKITCDLSIEGDFIKGTWQNGRSSGEIAATRFESTFVCGNRSMQLMAESEYNRLSARLAKLSKEFPLPPIPEALEEMR